MVTAALAAASAATAAACAAVKASAFATAPSDESLTVTEAVLPMVVRVKVSAPSVRLSLINVTAMMALPEASVVAMPVSGPATSAAVTPERVYAKVLPALTLVVLRVK